MFPKKQESSCVGSEPFRFRLKASRQLGIFCLCCTVLVFTLSTQFLAAERMPAQKVLVTKTLIKAELISPARIYAGVCPVTVGMTGVITTSSAIKLEYRFDRSDGAVSRFIPLDFASAGSKSVPFSWKLGKSGPAWVQLVVRANGKEIKSNVQEIEVKCDEGRQKIQLGTINWALVNKPALKMAPVYKADKKYFISLKQNIVGNIDLTVWNVSPEPKQIQANQTVIVHAYVANKGQNPAPACTLSVTLKASNPHPQHGDTFEFKYPIPQIQSGSGGWVHYPFHNFWAGTWKVFVKIDADNAVFESGNEANNTKMSYFIVH